MEQVNFSPLQKQIFDLIAKEDLFRKKFYFTGGTALSAFYLNHRISEDLDFFTETDLDKQMVINIIERITASLNYTYKYTISGDAHMFYLEKNKQTMIKVDFVYHPIKRLEKGFIYEDFSIDSLFDIAVNKLLTINQRLAVKDFVDLYFLLQKYTVWDLIYGIEKKYRMDLDLILIAGDMLQIKQINYLPHMLKPLTISDLQIFFINLARQISKKVVTE